ncbi:hypothetical protein TNIN_315191 [Trichonephila inaurata madagascariensis]|uniref:Uncharacterized protein n=1 Tax=Trichonephila inaurata madagascariensis TaxID=2747483 RepID=A0A8X7BSG7_9ARAC|nr:hypothetical protein TNIN_315191 [Trichonephila inaurata madagascariensis]
MVPPCGEPGLKLPGKRNQLIEGLCASLQGYHSNSFHDAVRRRASSCSLSHFQTPRRIKFAIQVSSPFTPIDNETLATFSTSMTCKNDMECHRLAKHTV